MHYKSSFSRKVFVVFNTCFITITCCLCLLPVLHTFALSLSSAAATSGGRVGIWPVEFELGAYKMVIEDHRFLGAFLTSVKRVALGLVVDMAMTILAAYPLSKTKAQFPYRNLYMVFFIIPMYFGGGLIPTFLIVNKTGLLDSLWALVLPGAVATSYIILLLNYFRSLPDEIYESARVDGAGEWRILAQIILPLAKPILAVLVVYIVVRHWNSWFDGMLYINSVDKYPLQSYLQTLIVELNPMQLVNIEAVKKNFTTKNVSSARMFVAMVPVLCVYPFAQKYFIKGIVLGSVKG